MLKPLVMLLAVGLGACASQSHFTTYESLGTDMEASAIMSGRYDQLPYIQAFIATERGCSGEPAVVGLMIL